MRGKIKEITVSEMRADMKKIKLFIVSISVMALLFSGCASPDSENAKDAAKESIVSAGVESESTSEYEGASAKADEMSSAAEKETENETKEETENETKGETSDNGNQPSESAAVPKETTKEETTASPKPTVKETEKATSATEASTKKTFVKTDTETGTETLDYKYGVKKIVTYTKIYNIYSDGSKELADSLSSSKYDVSGYSATDQQLKAESDSKAEEYMSYYNEVLRLVNEIRAEVGAAPLTLDTTMCKAATMRAIEMNYSNLFSHTRPDGRSCFSVLGFYGISSGAAGENIAAGYRTPQNVVEGWKRSEGHYKNMINSSYKRLGVGLSREQTGDYSDYWVQLFSS